MTRLIVESDNQWSVQRIRTIVDTEVKSLGRALERIRNKIKGYERRYGTLDRERMYGTIDDMELVEWEGELEMEGKISEKLNEFGTRSRG